MTKNGKNRAQGMKFLSNHQLKQTKAGIDPGGILGIDPGGILGIDPGGILGIDPGGILGSRKRGLGYGKTCR